MTELETARRALPEPLRGRLDTCLSILRDLGKVVVAFSGGVDSTTLLALARQVLGAEGTLAVTAVCPLNTRREVDEARALARQLETELVEVPGPDLSKPTFAHNPPDRCYHCKKELFGALTELARGRGFSAVVSGANADDHGDFRPGHKALKELGVRNPLMEAGMTKADIRAVAKALGLAVWNKPPYACLATRIPYGQAVTAEKLARIEQAEYVLRDLGFLASRVRDHGALARLEVPAEQLAELVAQRDRVVGPLKALGYAYVAVDLQGFRSGSMNEVL